MLEDHGGRIELKDAADFRAGQRGAWMRLRFAVTGRSPSTIEVKREDAPTPPHDAETKAPQPETNGQAETTNSETKIRAATGN